MFIRILILQSLFVSSSLLRASVLRSFFLTLSSGQDMKHLFHDLDKAVTVMQRAAEKQQQSEGATGGSSNGGNRLRRWVEMFLLWTTRSNVLHHGREGKERSQSYAPSRNNHQYEVSTRLLLPRASHSHGILPFPTPPTREQLLVPRLTQSRPSTPSMISVSVSMHLP